MKSHYLIVVAGGSGTRMGGSIPKQFMLLAGKPVLMHTLELFAVYDRSMKQILVLPEDHIAYWESLCKEFGFVLPHRVVAGGENRFSSVRNGLALLKGEGLVAVHDGVRPLVSIETVRACFEMAEQYGSAVPVVPVVESVRRLSGDDNFAENRSSLVAVQTPQVFRLSTLKRAYEQPYDLLFTDDASVVERLGEKISLAPGNRENIKLTQPLDFMLAELMLAGIDQYQ